ncbi:hypothetical protein NQ317_012232 [Molorchus minor]|uniref:Uncharacterized protein n=1 Tax=Molorchus minor TaxID=1323400 RepID=A0ABQ9IQC1_9CUCU|nr:hypothetical protein NQ317_012232 [Molorchus minor]
MVNHTIDIYYFPLSPPSRCALLLIRALGLKHNIKIINIPAGEQMAPEFLKINPLHTIPAINDDGFILYDSHAIIKYLANQYGKDDSLCPKDPKKEAIVNQRLFFDATYLFPRFADFAGPTIFTGRSPSDESRKKLAEALQHIDNFLKNQQWIAGANMTIADFSIISSISTIDALGEFDLTTYGNVWQWYQRAKDAMSSFGYDEVNQTGATAFGEAFKSKLK